MEEQIRWCKEQDRILGEIESKLHEMKIIVVFVIDHELASEEFDEFNNQLNKLKREVYALEKQLHSIVH